MKPFTRILTFIAVMLLAPVSPAQDKEQKPPEQKPARQIWIRLKSGPILTGDLVKMDSESIDFTVKGVLQSVKCDDLIGVMFTPPPPPKPKPKPEEAEPGPTPAQTNPEKSEPMTASLRPTILHREKAKYTREARDEGVQGTVVLQVVFNVNESITDIKVIRGLPYGLTENAIEAAKKIRFRPATKDGAPVSVRGALEFTFNLYSASITLLTPGNKAEFSHYPRKMEFKWKPVENAALYRVLIFQSSSDPPEWIRLQDREITGTEFVFYFPDAQMGQWRVEAIDADGRLIAVSEWRVFRFTK